MNLDWKWAAGPAIVAFLLSFLTGLIAGVDFLVVLLRAILGSALFGAVGAGLGMVVARQLPELLEVREQAVATETERPGPRVDITVGDEEGEAPFEEGEAPFAGGEASGFDEAPAQTGEGDAGALESLDSDRIESLQPTDAQEGESKPSYDATSREDITESLVEEVEEATLPEEELTRASQFEEEQTQSEELQAVDELPDIGGFDGAFPQSEGEATGSGSASTGSTRSAPEGVDAGNDPAQIAKALQTMLKRDS